MRIKRIRLGRTATLLAIALAVFLVVASASSTIPRAIIKCDVCVNFQQVAADAYTASVNIGTTITLTGDLGYQSYAWSKNGAPFAGSNNRVIKVNITEKVKYSLIVVGQGGSDTRSIEISATAPPANIGLPELSDITLDPDLGRTHFAVGDKFWVEMRCDTGGYSNIQCYWDVGTGSGLAVGDKYSPKTLITVVSWPSAGKNPEISAVVTNGISFNKKTVQIVIVDNTAPTIKIGYTIPLSHRPFSVNCGECKTGQYGNEGGDFFSAFEVWLTGPDGKVIDSGKVTAKNGQNIASIDLSAGDECSNCTLKAKVTDSHGLSSTSTERLWIGFGNTEEDAPYIPISDTVSCEKDKPCAFDISKMDTHGLGVSIYFYDILDIANPSRAAVEPLFNIYRNPCRSFNCTTVFQFPGKRMIKITVQYMRNNRSSGKIAEKIVTVIVSEMGKITAPAPTQTARTTPIPTATTVRTPTLPPKLTPQAPPEVLPKPTPGLSPAAIFSALIATALLGRKNNKP